MIKHLNYIIWSQKFTYLRAMLTKNYWVFLQQLKKIFGPPRKISGYTTGKIKDKSKVLC